MSRLLLSVTATLAWLWGLLLISSAVVLAIPMIASGHFLGVLPLLLLVGPLGVALCGTGQLVRKRSRRARIPLFALPVLLFMFHAITIALPISRVGVWVAITLFVLGVLNWRALGRGTS